MRKGIGIIVSFVCILLASKSSNAQEEWVRKLLTQKWLSPITNVSLLQSTRDEVSSSLGNPQTVGYVDFYRTKYGEFRIEYTDSECLGEDGSSVPRGVVEEIFFDPEIVIKLSSLKLPIAQFARSKEEDAPSIVLLTHSAQGVEMEVQNGKITGLRFVVPAHSRTKCANR